MSNDHSNSSTASNLNYKLLYPVKHGSEDVLELNFRRPKLKHIRQLDSVLGDAGKLIKTLEILCDIPPSVVSEIDVADLEGINKIIQVYFPLPQTL